MSKSHRSLCVSFSRTDAGLCVYHLLEWSNLNCLHISQWITLPIQSYLVLYSFCATLLHSFIMWLIVSSLSPYSLHLLFCWVLSILALMWLVLMALWCCYLERLLLSSTPLEFFASVLANGFSLESAWQQFSSGLQDSSRDSGRSQQCCHLDSLYPSANFQLLFTPREFFTSALADGLSLEFEWQQVSSSLQNCPQ